ncbi:NAD(P)/FAD-dependent oxidoreductase [Thermobifida cellulosilytica]|uniref:Ferredoxin reductase n=1 Tax=Thermobifida cellulosilytica TB100 TaxID=665004 RepID=A0A147KM66_THECS|nr:FAD-dependent oxidoreductase [Thermobifida cellulosilytica]KUP98425.1 ferredoxin reductase [Thermobifida cellulosilytica TB100]
MQTIVVAGAGLAGLTTAEALRQEGFDGTIVLVGEEARPPYERPPLSKEVLTGRGSGRSLDLRSEAELAALDLDLRLGVRAVALRPGGRAVELSDGSELTADGVVVATGARARRPGTDLPGVHVLRTLDDAEEVRAGLLRHGRVVVVGAGFVGAEVAASARSLGAEVTLLEAADTPLTRVVDPRIGAVLAELHRDNGVELRLGVPVTAFEGTGRLERVRLADGSAVETPLAVAGLGVALNTEWLAGSGVALDPGGGVRCDEYSATSLPGVYAVGDLASWPHPRYGGRLRLEHWTNAEEQARAAAHNLLAGEGARQPYRPVPYFWSDQYGMKIQLLGQASPADTVEVVHGSAEDRKFVAFFGRAGRLVGVLGLRSTPKVMRYRPLLAEPTSWEDALAAAGR